MRVSVRLILACLAILVLAIAVSTVVHAEDDDENNRIIAPPPWEHPTSNQVRAKAEELLEEFDKNGDGKFGPREFPRPLTDEEREAVPDELRRIRPSFLTREETFELADINDNGLIGERELYDWIIRFEIREHSARWVRHSFEEWDANADNELDPREWPGSARNFEYTDTNEDDEVTRWELFQFSLDVIHRDLFGPDMMDVPSREDRRGIVRDTFNRLDANNDDALGPREFPERNRQDRDGEADTIRERIPKYLTRLEIFAIADTDNSGRLDRGELGAWLLLKAVRDHVAEWVGNAFSTHDDNEDNRINHEEWPATGYSFLRNDRDDNNVVTRMEAFAYGVERIYKDFTRYDDID